MFLKLVGFLSLWQGWYLSFLFVYNCGFLFERFRYILLRAFTFSGSLSLRNAAAVVERFGKSINTFLVHYLWLSTRTMAPFDSLSILSTFDNAINSRLWNTFKNEQNGSKWFGFIAMRKIEVLHSWSGVDFTQCKLFR